MTKRYRNVGATVNTTATTFNPGTPGAPDSWHYNLVGAPPAGTTGSTLYRVATTPTSAALILASASGVVSADVFVQYDHSFIE